MSHLKLYYCLKHPIYAVYIDQSSLYALSLHLRAVCHIVFVCVFIYMCSLYMSTYSCTHAFMHACGDAHTKSSSVPVDTKPEPPHPPIPRFLFPGGEIRQSVYLPAPSRRGAGFQDRRLWRWWGGDSLAVFTGWMCQLGV